MLYSFICRANTVTEYWLWFTKSVTHLLSSSGLLLTGLVALASLMLLSARFRRNHRHLSILGSAMIAGLLCFSLLLPPLGQHLLVGFLPPDSGEQADAIVVLGRGIDLQPQRTSVAANLFWAGRATQIFVSGAGDAPQIINKLQKQGIPETALKGESCSRTTAENAEFTATYLKPQKVQKIILVTDPLHMLRSMLTFRNIGFEVIPHPSPLPIRYNSHRARVLAIRESFGFISYGLLGRYQLKHSHSFTS